MIILILISSIISLNTIHFNKTDFKPCESLLQKKYNESQLIVKWYFLSKDNDDKSKTKNLSEGRSIVIKSNYKFKSDIFKKSESGSWNFDAETQTLLLMYKDRSLVWKLMKINDFGMVLINKKTNEKWIFTSE